MQVELHPAGLRIVLSRGAGGDDAVGLILVLSFQPQRFLLPVDLQLLGRHAKPVEVVAFCRKRRGRGESTIFQTCSTAQHSARFFLLDKRLASKHYLPTSSGYFERYCISPLEVREGEHMNIN